MIMPPFPQVIPHGEVLYDFPYLQPKAVNMLHLECLTVESQSWSLERRNQWKFSQTCSLKGRFAHHQTAFRHYEIHCKAQVRERCPPDLNDVFHDGSSILILAVGQSS